MPRGLRNHSSGRQRVIRTVAEAWGRLAALRLIHSIWPSAPSLTIEIRVVVLGIRNEEIYADPWQLEGRPTDV